MGARSRLFLVFIIAVIAVATWTYPFWRPEPVVEVQETFVFPELSPEEQQAFSALPPRIQQGYLNMLAANPRMAVDLVTARLQPPTMLEPEERELPALESAVVAATGEFGGVSLTENDERDLPQFADLYSASGQVTFYQFPDNRKLLRLENLNVVNGPNLRVILSTLPVPVSGEEILADSNRIDIGTLKTSAGSQTYESIPVEIDLANYATLVIYEATYNIIFAVAPIS